MHPLPEITAHIHEFLSSQGVFTLIEKEAYPHLEGVWGAGSAAILAAVLEENPDKNVVVLTSTQKTALDFQDDLPLFSERPILFFPWLNDLSEMLAVRDEDEESDEETLQTFVPDASVGERLRVLKTFLQASDC